MSKKKTEATTAIVVAQPLYTREQVDELIADAIRRELGDLKRLIDDRVSDFVRNMGETAMRESVAQAMLKACGMIAQDKLRSMDFMPIVTGVVTTQVSLSLQGIDFAGRDFGQLVRQKFDDEIRRQASQNVASNTRPPSQSLSPLS